MTKTISEIKSFLDDLKIHYTEREDESRSCISVTSQRINAPHRQPISFCEARTIAISTALTQATLALHKPSNRRCAVGASFVAGG